MVSDSIFQATPAELGPCQVRMRERWRRRRDGEIAIVTGIFPVEDVHATRVVAIRLRIYTATKSKTRRHQSPYLTYEAFINQYENISRHIGRPKET